MKPGASMVNQPILPGMLKRDSTDVLPMPYQFVSHCRPVNCTSRQHLFALVVYGNSVATARQTHHREEFPDREAEFPRLTRRWTYALYDRHCGVKPQTEPRERLDAFARG